MELLLLFILPIGAMLLVALIPDQCINRFLEHAHRNSRRPTSTAPISEPPASDEPWPYYAKHLMTEVEQIFFHRLLQVLPDHRVFVQVQLSQILGVLPGNNYYRWYGHVSRMSVDYVICSKDARIVAAIELDDSSHLQPERIAADQKKDRALSDAGIPTLRIPVKGMPGIADLTQLLAFLSAPAAPEPEHIRPREAEPTELDAAAARDGTPLFRDSDSRPQSSSAQVCNPTTPHEIETLGQNPREAPIPPLSLAPIQSSSTASATPQVAI
jgi:hypothetical protein